MRSTDLGQVVEVVILALMLAACSSTPDAPEQGGAPVESRDGGTSSSNVSTVTATPLEGKGLPAVVASHPARLSPLPHLCRPLEDSSSGPAPTRPLSCGQ